MCQEQRYLCDHHYWESSSLESLPRLWWQLKKGGKTESSPHNFLQFSIKQPISPRYSFMFLFPLNNQILDQIVAKGSFSLLPTFAFCREGRNKVSGGFFVGFFLRSPAGQHNWTPLHHGGAQSPCHWPKGWSELLSWSRHRMSSPFCNFHPSQLNSTSLQGPRKALPSPQINELCLTRPAGEMQGYISPVKCLLFYSRKWIRRQGHFRQKSYCKANSNEVVLWIILFLLH